MKEYRALFPKLVGCVLLALAVAAGAARIASGQAQPKAETPPYRPGMGDFMTAGVQPRHLKLAAAAQTGNWEYAAYALKEMGETFDRITRTLPVYRTRPTADLIAATVKAPMAALDAAIKAGDAAQFKAAYSELTQGCNECHEDTDRAMVRIQVPETVPSFPDQDFRPVKR